MCMYACINNRAVLNADLFQDDSCLLSSAHNEIMAKQKIRTLCPCKLWTYMTLHRHIHLHIYIYIYVCKYVCIHTYINKHTHNVSHGSYKAAWAGCLYINSLRDSAANHSLTYATPHIANGSTWHERLTCKSIFWARHTWGGADSSFVRACVSFFWHWSIEIVVFHTCTLFQGCSTCVCLQCMHVNGSL